MSVSVWTGPPSDDLNLCNSSFAHFANLLDAPGDEMAGEWRGPELVLLAAKITAQLESLRATHHPDDLAVPAGLTSWAIDATAPWYVHDRLSAMLAVIDSAIKNNDAVYYG